jgi:hypothetical protein
MEDMAGGGGTLNELRIVLSVSSDFFHWREDADTFRMYSWQQIETLVCNTPPPGQHVGVPLI